jgi:hypothetical protein
VTRRRRWVLLTLAIPLLLVACSDDDDSTPTTESTTSTTAAPTDTIAPDDPELAALLITTDDLPEGFAPNEGVDNTITAFCAGQDAAGGLSAEGRAIAGFTRTPAGAAVIEVVFRFEDDGAAQFLAKAEELIGSCSDVPDETGLAFTYAPLSEPVAATLAGAESSTGAVGTSVGSGNFTVQIGVIQQGDLGALVAVLGLDDAQTDLDALASTAFAAAVAGLAG